jgi:hypothetical protein
MVELRASTSTATPPTEVLDPAAPEQLGPSGTRIRADPRWRRPSVFLAQGHLTGSMPCAASSWCRRRWLMAGCTVQAIPITLKFSKVN